MPAYILTGAPGSGKTAILRMLETLGYLVVEEAATDVIALENALGRDEPWAEPGFIDKIVALQRQRRERALADRARDRLLRPVTGLHAGAEPLPGLGPVAFAHSRG